MRIPRPREGGGTSGAMEPAAAACNAAIDHVDPSSVSVGIPRWRAAGGATSGKEEYEPNSVSGGYPRWMAVGGAASDNGRDETPSWMAAGGAASGNWRNETPSSVSTAVSPGQVASIMMPANEAGSARDGPSDEAGRNYTGVDNTPSDPVGSNRSVRPHEGGQERGRGRPAANTVQAWWADRHQEEDDQLKVEFLNNNVCILRCSIHETAGDVAHFDINYDCVDGICDCMHEIAGRPAQLKPCRVFCELFLRGDTDPDWAYILMGVVFGFNVINPSCTAEYGPGRGRVKNPDDREFIAGKLLAEIDRGCISVVDEAPTCVHDIFCIPKEGGGSRSIVDCSKPSELSVNNYVDEVAVRFSYNSVDDVAAAMEVGDYLSTVDIKDAYRAVSIHPRDRDRQGLHWNFDPTEGSNCTYMKDNRLCMGLASSPYVFSKISDFVVRCAVREGVDRVINYLDDFCIVSGTHIKGREEQRTVIAILRRIGFHISFSKIISPATCTRFLGININSVTLEMSLPGDKLQKLVQVLDLTRGRKKLTRRELERLGGYLAHCSKVIKGGRTFCRRIYDAMGTVREPYFKVRIDAGFREDILWWYNFASRFNGKARILGRFAAHVATYSDASSWGYGASHGTDWRAGAFQESDDRGLQEILGHHHRAPPPDCDHAHINVREMWAAYCAALSWGSLWANSAVVMVTDSTTVRAALNTGRSRCPEIMSYLRKLFWLACEYNFEFSSVYIRSSDNTVCDALSRLDDPKSASRIREADTSQLMCCSHIFKDGAFSTCRGGRTDEGEADVPGPLIRP